MTEMRRRKTPWVACMILGLALIAGSVGLVLYNLRTEADAGAASTEILTEIAALSARADEEGPGEWDPYEYLREEASAQTLPLVEIDGEKYVGVITIPALDLQLPVLAEWSYPNLKIGPCRYFGSVATENLVIIAHNYSTHFGGIKNLSPGSQVIFANMDGQPNTYVVSAMEVVTPDATADVVSGEWPLTLCTCSIGGRTRVVIRCDWA